jgi:hypothetical protein
MVHARLGRIASRDGDARLRLAHLNFPGCLKCWGAKRRSDPDFVIAGWSEGPVPQMPISHRAIPGFRIRCFASPGMTDASRLHPDGKTVWVRREAIGRPCVIRPLEQTSRQSVIGNAPTQVTNDRPDERAACSAPLDSAYAIAADDANRRQEAEYERPEKTVDADRSAPRRKSKNFAAQFAPQAATGAEGLAQRRLPGRPVTNPRKKRKRL